MTSAVDKSSSTMEETPVAKEAAIKRTASQNGHTDERNSGESGSRRSYTPGCFDILFGPKGIGAEKAKDAQGHEHTREEVNRRLRWSKLTVLLYGCLCVYFLRGASSFPIC